MDIDREKAAEIVKLMRAGLNLEKAAVVAGVAPQEAEGWYSLGQVEPDGPCGAFANRVERARATMISNAESMLRQNAILCLERPSLKHALLESRGQKSDRRAALRQVGNSILDRLRKIRNDVCDEIDTLIAELDEEKPPFPLKNEAIRTLHYVDPAKAEE